MRELGAKILTESWNWHSFLGSMWIYGAWVYECQWHNTSDTSEVLCDILGPPKVLDESLRFIKTRDGFQHVLRLFFSLNEQQGTHPDCLASWGFWGEGGRGAGFKLWSFSFGSFMCGLDCAVPEPSLKELLYKRVQTGTADSSWVLAAERLIHGRGGTK